MTPRGLDTVLILGCLFSAFSLSVWSLFAAGAFFLLALALTALRHMEAVRTVAGRGSRDAAGAARNVLPPS